MDEYGLYGHISTLKQVHYRSIPVHIVHTRPYSPLSKRIVVIAVVCLGVALAAAYCAYRHL
jgi:hypothetical protein